MDVTKISKFTSKFNCRAQHIAGAENTLMPFPAYARFCKETTLHGLKHTVSDNYHILERLLWFVLTVSAFGGAVYCGLNQFYRYNSEPVVVSLQRDYRAWWTTFPAITACFIERLHPEMARKEIERIWNVTEDTDLERFQYYYGFIEQIAAVSFRNNLQNFWRYQNDETVKGIDLLKLARDVHPHMTLSVTVSQTKKQIEWIPVMTEEGLCQTLNSEYAKYQSLLEDTEWKQEELLKCHYHSGQCFVRINSSANVVRYFVHSPFDIATAISNPTGEVMPDEELIIDYKVVEIQAASRVKTLTPEQRRCRYPDEWLSDTIKPFDPECGFPPQAYSFGLCQMHCRNRMALMFCGCRPYFNVIGDGDVCDAHGMACIGRNVEILINLPKNLAKCSCIPQCAELNYYSHTKKVSIRNESEDSDAAAIAMYNLMPPRFRLHRDVIFSLEDLFASLGGTTALFVGVSVLTVIETILFIVRYLVELIFNSKIIVNLERKFAQRFELKKL